MLHAFPAQCPNFQASNPQNTVQEQKSSPVKRAHCIVLTKINLPIPPVNLSIWGVDLWIKTRRNVLKIPTFRWPSRCQSKGDGHDEWMVIDLDSGSWSPIFFVWNKHWINIGAEWCSQVSFFFFSGVLVFFCGEFVILRQGRQKHCQMRVSRGPGYKHEKYDTKGYTLILREVLQKIPCPSVSPLIKES